MAKAGKIIALIAGILTFIGTFGFSLITLGSGLGVHYGIGGVLSFINNIIPIFSSWNAVTWIIVVGYFIFLLSFVLQLIGIKSRIAAFFGSLLPIAISTIIFLAYFGVWADGLNLIIAFVYEPLVVDWFPMTFGFGLEMTTIWGQLLVDLGTFIVAVGGLLSFVSVFLTREDF